MGEEKRHTEEETWYTEAEATKFFAIQFNSQTWDLLDKADRTKEEDELMILSAHASCRHWLEVGTGLHHQRAEWMISRVYSVLGLGETAVRHADRCLELTEEYADLMEDFGRAFAYECVARASAIAGDRNRARKYIELAKEAGEAIADQDSEDIFFADFNGGTWNDLR
jgi:phosphoribosylformimino-5-aminoimidazole carboxamide ribonucleotide (ProFAR) isomerase